MYVPSGPPSKPVTRDSWIEGSVALTARTLAPRTGRSVSQLVTLPVIVPSVLAKVGSG